MRLVQLTPGAGGMYCGNCLRDNALVAALRRQGHAVTLLPFYLPLKTDERDESRGAPVFMGGINVYLSQRVPGFRYLPTWLHRWLDRPGLLRLVGTRAAQTRPDQVGDLTVSMLRGEMGNQAREVDEVVAWLARHERPEVVSLSNALLVGLVRRLKRDVGARVCVTLQGEDYFLDALGAKHRKAAWELVAERLSEADVIVSPSRYYAEQMARRTGLSIDRIQIVPNGLTLEGWRVAEAAPKPPVLGFLARMCPDKGLDRLVDSYVWLRKEGRVPGLQLRIGGGLGPGDAAYVEEQKRKLDAAGVLGDVEFHPNLEHGAKQAFYRSLSVLSVPAHYGEAFGLYLIEAMAAGVPVVQPRTGAFPEIVGESGAGLIREANDPVDLARGIEQVLLDRELAGRLGRAGRAAVERLYNSDAAALAFARVLAAPGAP